MIYGNINAKETEAAYTPVIRKALDILRTTDVLFYKERSDVHEIMLPMTDGCYAIFFPEDVHRPCCMMDAPEDVKKIVLKVRVDSL